MDKRYKVLSQIGKGLTAKVYLVEDKFKCTYAAKQYRKNKSEDGIINEINLQRKCAIHHISPKIVGYSLTDKYIVMEKLNSHLYSLIVDNGGILSQYHQEELVQLFQKLDRIGVFQGDPNLLNYMLRNGKIYMIDFGRASFFDTKTTTETRTPNMDVSLLGVVLKMKEIGFPPISYKYLAARLPIDKQAIVYA